MTTKIEHNKKSVIVHLMKIDQSFASIFQGPGLVDPVAAVGEFVYVEGALFALHGKD